MISEANKKPCGISVKYNGFTPAWSRARNNAPRGTPSGRPRVQRIVNGEREDPIQAVEAFDAVPLIQVQQNFRVRLRAEAMARGSQFRAQFTVIVDLAVEHQGERGALLLSLRPQHHRLAAGRRQIDDGQAAMTEAGSRLIRNLDPQRSLAVRTPMRHAVGHALQQIGGKIALHSDDAAHLGTPRHGQGAFGARARNTTPCGE